MAGFTCSNSINRSDAPAARCKSPHTSDNEPKPPATMAPRMMNCSKVPPVMRWAITSCAPTQSTLAKAVKKENITTAVIAARARVRTIAVTKLLSTVWRNALPSRSSLVKACTVTTAFMVSLARALVSARRSWLWRDNRRTQRPNRISGTMIRITAPRISAVSFRLVKNIRINPPVRVTRLRNASEAEEPITVCTRVVSAVSRDSTSPVRVTSKKAGVSASTLANTAVRMSAVTRSPSQVTK